MVNLMKRVVFDSGPFNPLYEKMTSSTKPEIQNSKKSMGVVHRNFTEI